jgi:exopolyphosphatase/guanosine-5'-triphosphate,3'-diphosphate pyrophosphatase
LLNGPDDAFMELQSNGLSRRDDEEKAGRVAVVDIGSNTVRLVVYDAPMRLPIPLFNEKAQCALGRGLAETGRLNPKGVAAALDSLARFIRLAEAMEVGRLDLVATAAVRDAADGAEFVAEIERRFGKLVTVLSGAEEARLAALGVLSGIPQADGILGDLGGGSLDLVALEDGSFADHATLPLGHLRLAEFADDDAAAPAELVDRQLAAVPWLGTSPGRTFYAVGGAWRALARIFIEQTGHPLHVVDNFSIVAVEARHLAEVIAGLSAESVDRIPVISRSRLESVPAAATVMRALIDLCSPKQVVFSGFSMREGQLLQGLPAELRQQDPLISACIGFAERTGRFSISGNEILDWMEPLFVDDPRFDRRLCLAACLLSDIGWTEHPDYRAEHAFHRVLRVPFAGLTHRDRVFLALAIFVRYNGDVDAPVVGPVRRLLDGELESVAKSVGLALRLAHTLSGSAPGLLSRTQLKAAPPDLDLHIPSRDLVFVSETVSRRFRTLARSKGLQARIT